MDILTSKQRSFCMSRIKGRNTKPEEFLRRALWSRGLRYRLHYKLPGKPDIVFPRLKIAIFVDGCFWHGCPIHSTAPKTNSEFWREKLSGNQLRDIKVNQILKTSGWKVLRFWEHKIKKDVSAVLKKVEREVYRAKRA